MNFKRILYLIIIFSFVVNIPDSFGQQKQKKRKLSAPKISAELVKKLVFVNRVKFVFVNSSTFGAEHICNDVFISYTLVPPHDSGEKIRLKIPKNYYIFCY